MSFFWAVLCALNLSLLSLSPASQAREQLLIEGPNRNVLHSPPAPSHAVILQYHHVSDSSPASTSISVAEFRQHLNWLHQHKFSVLALDEIIAALREGRTLPERSVAITFDDGYADVYHNALPLLSRYGFAFSVFIHSEAIDAASKAAKGNSAVAKMKTVQAKPSASHYLTWQQAREMLGQGALFLNHSQQHNALIQPQNDESQSEWAARIKQDIISAQTRIDQQLGPQPRLFAYPYGEATLALEALLASLGYTSFGQHSGPIGPQSNFNNLPRFPLSGPYSDSQSFAVKMWSLPFPFVAAKPIESVLRHEQDKPILSLSLGDQHSWIALQCFASDQGKINVQPRLNQHFDIQARRAIAVGRSRYNCTHPSAFKIPSTGGEPNKRYYWYSKPWIRRDHNQQIPPP